MKSSNGIILIAIGLAILLFKISIPSEIISHLSNAANVLLVIAGVCWIGSGITGKRNFFYSALIATLGVVVTQSARIKEGNSIEFTSDIPEKLNSNSNFNHDYNSTIKRGVVEITGGASTFDITSGTDKLVDAEVLNIATLTDEEGLEVTETGDRAYIKLEHKNSASKIDLILHKEPIWEIKAALGANYSNFDISQLKVEKFDIASGASSLEIKYGALIENSKLEIASGASNIQLLIPHEVGIKFTNEGLFNNQNFKGLSLEKHSDGSLISSNYESSRCKLVIKTTTAMSNLSIQRY